MCSIIKGDLPVAITWLHNNETLSNGEGISITQVNKKLSTLSIDSVHALNIGEFTCVASNKAGASTYSSYLHVNGIYISFCSILVLLVLPQIHPFDFGEEQINSGESVSLTCSISKGDLPVQISWLYNNRTIDEFENSGILARQASKKISNLEIDSVQANHIGEYTCTATNKAGTTTYSAYLHVNGLFDEILRLFSFTTNPPFRLRRGDH